MSDSSCQDPVPTHWSDSPVLWQYVPFTWKILFIFCSAQNRRMTDSSMGWGRGKEIKVMDLYFGRKTISSPPPPWKRDFPPFESDTLAIPPKNVISIAYIFLPLAHFLAFYLSLFLNLSSFFLYLLTFVPVSLLLFILKLMALAIFSPGWR